MLLQEVLCSHNDSPTRSRQCDVPCNKVQESEPGPKNLYEVVRLMSAPTMPSEESRDLKVLSF
uniref:Uncharacterized protein n=1 Tax=Tetraselmis sp. GSL018 TaxID=582737 RepID=A0A061RI98_9CHLO